MNTTIRYYDTHSDNFISDTLNVDMSELYRPFLDMLKPNSRILDAGCGSGRDTLYFLRNGYSVEAFDASIEMVKHARKLTGVDVKHNAFSDVDTSEKYDGIWCCASLLHLNKADVISNMKILSNVLNVDGVWYVSFKYGTNERNSNGRFFIDLDENGLLDVIDCLDGIELHTLWTTPDKRVDRNEKWLNAILIKRNIL